MPIAVNDTPAFDRSAHVVVGDQVGGGIVVREVKIQKRRYNAPSFEVLDINAAKEQLDTKAISKDEDAQQMLSVIEKQLEKKSASSPRRST